MRFPDRWWIVMAALCVLASACNQSDQSSGDGNASVGFFEPRATVPSGTSIEVRLTESVSSETAGRGDRWQGVVTSPVIVEGREVIPAGSPVEGAVVAVREARKGSRAMLELQVRSVVVGARRANLPANSEPVIAGSTRARNLGAIAGGAAAGALIGKAVGGDGDDAAKGAIIGGALATGAVAASKGYQVVLRDGTVMTFLLNRDVAVAVS